jgi:hypothetical protein
MDCDSDLIIVGSGAGGATAFFENLNLGKSCILIEEGKYSIDSFPDSDNITGVTHSLYRNGGVLPAISPRGGGKIMIAEGKAIGGGTEINGGLFWKTPKFVLDDWVLRGFSNLDLVKFDEDLNFYEKKLFVADAKVRKNYDLDSQKLVYGAQLLGLNIAVARRLAPSCAKNNLCPSGCPSGAKLTMSRTLIREGVCQGGKLISDAKVIKINCMKSHLEVIVKKDQVEKKYSTKQVILSGGAIETPRLLNSSNLLKTKKTEIKFHTNLKVIACFSEKIFAYKGTIFTHQIQEFIAEGLLIMATNFNKTYLAMASSHIKRELFLDLLSDYEHLGLYTAQIKTDASILDFHIGPQNKVLYSRFSQYDLIKLKNGLIKTCEILFKAGAKYLILPINNPEKVYSLKEAYKVIYSLKIKNLTMTTVHLMSSMPISNINSQVENDARIKADSRIRIFDASILPTPTVESPQATIMALTRYLINQRST